MERRYYVDFRHVLITPDNSVVELGVTRYRVDEAEISYSLPPQRWRSNPQPIYFPSGMGGHVEVEASIHIDEGRRVPTTVEERDQP